MVDRDGKKKLILDYEAMEKEGIAGTPAQVDSYITCFVVEDMPVREVLLVPGGQDLFLGRKHGRLLKQ